MKKILLLFLLLVMTNSLWAYQYTIVCYSDYSIAAGQWNVSCFVSEQPCSEQSEFYMFSGQLTYCHEFNAMAAHPDIFVDGSGGAVLSDNGRTVKIQSDALTNFLEESKIKFAKGNLSKEAFQQELGKLTKADAGKVSKERLAKIAKDLNAKIIEVKQLPETNYCPACKTEATTKDKRSGLKDVIKTQVILTLGGGFSHPSQGFKNANNAGNLSQFNANVFVPILQYGGATGGVINFGFNAGVEYLSGNQDYNTAMYKPYNITGQSTPPTTTAKGSGGPKQAGFKTEAGVQANFNFGNFSISPMLNAAYISLKQKSFDVMQTSSVNGQTKDFSLYSQSETKTNGIGFIPKIRLGYQLGANSNFGIYTEAAYLFGPTVTTVSNVFSPNGMPNPQGSYYVDQIMMGSQKSVSSKSNLNLFSVNFGLSYSIRKKKGKKEIKTQSGGGKGKVSIQDFTLMRTKATNDTGGMVSKSGGVVSSSYAAGKTIPQNPNQEKGITEKGIKRSEKSMPSRLSMTPTTTKQTQGQNFGEKVATGLQSGANVVVQGASLLGGAMPNTVKNANQTIGNTSSTDKSVSSNSGSDATKQQITENPTQGKSTSENGAQIHEQSMPSRLSMTPTTTKQTQGQNFGEKVSSGLQSGANAVGQGASLLGAAMPTTVKNTRKSIGNTTTKSGGAVSSSYAAGKTIPQNPNQEKGHNEKGIKRSDLNYAEDYYVQDEATLKFLNTDELIIKKGNYKADYSHHPFGAITLELSKPIDAKSINEKGVKRMSSSGFHCDRDCKEEADVCWTCKTKSSSAFFYHYDLQPIIENGMITKLKITNTKVSINDKALSAKQYQELIGK